MPLEAHGDGQVQHGRLMAVDEVAHGLPLVQGCARGQALHALHAQPAVSQRLLIVAARPRRELLRMQRLPSCRGLKGSVRPEGMHCLPAYAGGPHLGEDVDDVHAVPSQLDVADEVEMVWVHQAEAAPPPVVMGQRGRVRALYSEISGLQRCHWGEILP